MYCENCGTKLDDAARFCTSCGKSVTVDTPTVQNNQPVQNLSSPLKKKKSKAGLWALIAFLSLAAVAVGINLFDMFIINSPAKLEKKLEDTVWYTEPTTAVTVGGDKSIYTAYSIEFHSNGKATITTYWYDCPRYEDAEYSDMEVKKVETVKWSIDNKRNLRLDGEEYECKTIMGDKEDRWYFEDDRLHINRTYYEDDEWGYSE